MPCAHTSSPARLSCAPPPVCLASYIWFAGIFSFDIDVFFKSLDVPVPSIVQEYLSFIMMMLTMGILLAVYMCVGHHPTPTCTRGTCGVARRLQLLCCVVDACMDDGWVTWMTT